MKHITGDKGDIGVFKIITDLLTKGYQVFTPISATCPFDLLIDKNGFKRIQVKYKTISKNNTLDVILRRNIRTITSIYYENNEVDIIAIYCPNLDKCYYIDQKELISNSISLRIFPSKNKQLKNIHLAENYLEFK